jgi:hypothetical protein
MCCSRRNAASDATLWRRHRPAEGCAGMAEQVREEPEPAGAARLVLLSGAALLHPGPAVFEAMLAGWRVGETSSAAGCSPPEPWFGASGSCGVSRSSPTSFPGGGPPPTWRSGPVRCCLGRDTRTRRFVPTRARWPASVTIWSTPTTAGRVSAKRASVLIRCRSATSGTPRCMSWTTRAGRPAVPSPAPSCRPFSTSPTRGWWPSARAAARAGWPRSVTRRCSR